MPRGTSLGLWMVKKLCGEEEERRDDTDEGIGEESRDDNDKGSGACPEHTGTSRIVVRLYILSLGSISQKSVVSGSLLGPASGSPKLQVCLESVAKKVKLSVRHEIHVPIILPSFRCQLINLNQEGT